MLVTGGAGFVGVHLVRTLAARGAAVTALTLHPPDEATLAFVADHAEQIHWVRGDVTDRDATRDLVADGISHVVHAAAITATPIEERRATARVFDVNAGGTLNVLEAAREAQIERFVFVSSSGLYGSAPPLPALDESTPLRTGGLYTIAKAASEQLALRYHELHRLSVAIGRLGTAYGPMERPTASRRTLSPVQRALLGMQEAIAAGREFRVRGSAVARDFVHVDDAADAFVRLTASPDTPHHVYNVGPSRAAPLSEALDALAAATGGRWREVGAGEPVDLEQTAAHARAAMNTERLERDVGWGERYELASGARATLAWNERWNLVHADRIEGRT